MIESDALIHQGRQCGGLKSRYGRWYARVCLGAAFFPTKTSAVPGEIRQGSGETRSNTIPPSPVHKNAMSNAASRQLNDVEYTLMLIRQQLKDAPSTVL